MASNYKPFLLTCIIVSTALLGAAFESYTLHTARGQRAEQFTDNNNNLQISIYAPDNWNSGTAAAYIHNLNWHASGLATANDDGSAFFAIVDLPPLANMFVPFG